MFNTGIAKCGFSKACKNSTFGENNMSPAATTTTSSVKSENKLITDTSVANNTTANAATNSPFSTSTFTPPTTIGTTASVTTTSANIFKTANANTTAPTSDKNTTSSSEDSLFGRIVPTVTSDNDVFGQPKPLFGPVPHDSNQHKPLFVDLNRLFPNKMVHEAVQIKEVGQVGAVMSSYIWKISNFSDLCKSSEKVVLCVSPMFMIGSAGLGEKRCKMYLYPCGTSTLSKDYASINIECQNNVNSEAQITFSILDANLQIVNETFSSPLTTTSDPATKMGCSQFIKRDTLLDANNGLLSNDTLTILCRISLKTLDVGRPVFSLKMKINKDFEGLFESEKFSDFVVEVENHEFDVHRSVLAARSPTFREMFENASDAANEEQNKFKLHDVKYEVMEQVLRFIYTEKVNGLNELANELLVAAVRFKLDDLKALCEESLFKNVNVTNVADVHVLADKHDSKWLKDRTTDFIIDNVHSVMKTSAYKGLVGSHPHLLDELLSEIVQRKISRPIEQPVPSL